MITTTTICVSQCKVNNLKTCLTYKDLDSVPNHQTKDLVPQWKQERDKIT